MVHIVECPVDPEFGVNGYDGWNEVYKWTLGENGLGTLLILKETGKYLFRFNKTCRGAIYVQD